MGADTLASLQLLVIIPSPPAPPFLKNSRTIAKPLGTADRVAPDKEVSEAGKVLELQLKS